MTAIVLDLRFRISSAATGCRVAMAAACLLLAVASQAAAHPAPYSYIDLDLTPGHIQGSVVVHVFDAAHDLGLPDAERLLDPAFLDSQAGALRALLRPRLEIAADGQRLDLQWGGVQIAPDRHGVRVSFEANAPGDGRVDLSTVVFPYDPQHQTFVNVYETGSLRHQAILDAGHPRLQEYFAGTADGVRAVMAAFVPAGIRHILIGPDHVLFLVALIVLGGTLTRLLTIVTAFTIGHSITLSLAATNLVTLPSRVVEPAIALSIVFVGVDNLMVARSRDSRDLRAWAALAFGLVHGFGFAAVLREIGLPPTALGWSLFSFNAGVEIGQLAIVTVVAGLVAAIRRRSEPMAQRIAFAASIVVIVAGTWWFAQRVLA